MPERLNAAEREAAVRLLGPVPEPLAQQVLDELAGRLAKSAVRVAPLSYLRGLVKAVQAGDFSPELGPRVEEHRRRRAEERRALERLEAKICGPPRASSRLENKLLAVRDRPRPVLRDDLEMVDGTLDRGHSRKTRSDSSPRSPQVVPATAERALASRRQGRGRGNAAPVGPRGEVSRDEGRQGSA